MKLSQLKQHLKKSTSLQFELPDGSMVPPHFHITEVGRITRDFIDCGGVVRSESIINMQLWHAGDIDHRLDPKKLAQIIKLSEKKLKLDDLNVGIEYQTETIGRYSLEVSGEKFVLTPKQTDCLAKDSCGISADLLPKKECCGSGCC